MWLSKNSSKKPVWFWFDFPSAKADGNSERMIKKLPSVLTDGLESR